MAENQITNPLKAIRSYCVQCKGLRLSLKCENSECPLYDFRSGKNPFRKVNITPERRAEMSERMAKMRACRKN